MREQHPILVRLRCDSTPLMDAVARMQPLLECFAKRFGNAVAEGFADLIHKGVEARFVEGGPAAGADGDYIRAVVVSIPWVDEVFPAVRAGNGNRCRVCGHERPFHE